MKALILAALKSPLFRSALTDIVLDVLEYLAKKSDNRLDDTLVKRVRDALTADEHEQGV